MRLTRLQERWALLLLFLRDYGQLLVVSGCLIVSRAACPVICKLSPDSFSPSKQLLLNRLLIKALATC